MKLPTGAATPPKTRIEIDPDRNLPLSVISVTGADCPIAAPEVQMLTNAIADNKYRAMRKDRSNGSLRQTLKIQADLNTSNSKNRTQVCCGSKMGRVERE